MAIRVMNMPNTPTVQPASAVRLRLPKLTQSVLLLSSSRRRRKKF